MKKPPLIKNEKERLQSLYDYDILDTVEEEDFDELTRLASQICNTKISLVSLIDNDRQWFKSHHGLEVRETPKDFAFCGHAINEPNEPFIVEDARIDERFFDNPLVTGQPHVIFYAGVPLTDHDGLSLGTLCVIDDHPKKLSEDQISALNILSKRAMDLIELRKKNRELAYKTQELEKFAHFTAHDLKSPIISIISFTSYLKKYFNKEAPNMFEHLDLIKSTSEQLVTLIDDHLEIAKIESFNYDLKSWISPITLVDEIRKTYLSTSVTILTNAKIDQIFVHSPSLKIILHNLISNAIKYNTSSDPYVEIIFGKFDQGYKITVRDNGPGIKSEIREQLFKLKINETSQDKHGNTGTGFGLHLVQKLIEDQKGHIHLDNTFKTGTSLDITLYN